MKNRMNIKSSYFFIFLIITIYLCTVSSSYHAISFLALILVLVLVQSIYQTYSLLSQIELKECRNDIIFKLNRDIVICNKVLSLSNIGVLYSFSRWLYSVSQSFIKQDQPLLDGSFSSNLFLLVLVYLIRILSILVHFIKSPADFPFFDWSALEIIFLRPVFTKLYNIRNINSCTPSQLYDRAWFLNYMLSKKVIVGQSEIDFAKGAIFVYDKKAYILTELRSACQRLDSSSIDGSLVELDMLESICDYSFIESKYFDELDTILKEQQGLHKCLSIMDLDIQKWTYLKKN